MRDTGLKFEMLRVLACVLDTPALALSPAPVPEWKEVRKRSRERRSLPKDIGNNINNSQIQFLVLHRCGQKREKRGNVFLPYIFYFLFFTLKK